MLYEMGAFPVSKLEVQMSYVLYHGEGREQNTVEIRKDGFQS